MIASQFYGDGTTLTGVSKSVDLEQSNARISDLEKHIERFDPLEKVKPTLERSIKRTNLKLDEHIKRFDPLEECVSHNERISSMEPRVITIEKRLPSIGVCDKRLDTLEKSVYHITKRISSVEPRFH